MYRSKTENVEVYFICYKGEDMELVDTYYDEILDIHYWYFNAYLAYKYWKRRFRGLRVNNVMKNLLIVGASRYIIYFLENELYSDYQESESYKKDLEKIQKKLDKIIGEVGGFI